MDEQRRLQVLLELDPGQGDVLSGRIGTGGEIREFFGWLSLIAVIENARRVEAGARSPPGEVPSTRIGDRSGSSSDVSQAGEHAHHQGRQDE